MNNPQTTAMKSYGQIAFEANAVAWPPASQYVPWGHLTQTARDGWEIIAKAVERAVTQSE